jgi:anti-sigma regulatory factor (Ser/Thr protein kinase)
VSLPPHPTSVGQARRFVRDQLVALGIADPHGNAELVVSELVTNAVMHAGTTVTVRVARQGSGARVEVADGSDRLPGLRVVTTRSGSGRGLTLVEHFAHEWGAERTPTGKVVWFIVEREGIDTAGRGAG